MKIALASDLHLEFQDINLMNTEGAEVLILSGDILVAEDLHNHPEMDYGMYSNINIADLGRRQKVALRFRDFLTRCSKEFPHVVYVAGNHEFYHGRWKASLDHLRTECAKYPNVYFLERDIKVINEVSFIGATLWTDCNKNDR
jgi:predicted phosphodiesterase